MFGERLQNVFDVMGEGGDAAHADGVASAFQGVGDALGDLHVLEVAIASRQALDGGGELGGLVRELL